MNRLTPTRPDAAHQRARGALFLSFKRRGALTVLDGLRQDGTLKARFPRPEPDAPFGAVLLNSGGGVAGGDVLQTRITAGPGTAAAVATQAAERIYRALPGQVAAISTVLQVEAGAALEWLPQETILFNGCALQRRLTIELAADAVFTGVESLVFGRAAMGEEVRRAQVRDRIMLRRAGKLVLHDAVRLDGDVAALLDRAAVGRGGRAMATLIHAGPDAGHGLEALRAALAPFDAGATLVEGVLLARVVAPTGAALRQAVVTGLNILRGGRTLPRVWLC